MIKVCRLQISAGEGKCFIVSKYNEENWFETELQKDIWTKKYCHNEESFDEFFERVSGGNKNIKSYMILRKV